MPLPRLTDVALAANTPVALLNEWRGGEPVELPTIYFVVAVTVVLAGAGRYSIDATLGRRRQTRDRSAAIGLAAPVPVPGSSAR